MRWEKGSQFIAIESALSTEIEAEVHLVSSNLDWSKLPLEFKEQVRKSDSLQCEGLRNDVANWARAHGFLPTGAKPHGLTHAAR